MDFEEVARKLIRREAVLQTTWTTSSIARWMRDDFKCVYCGKYMLETYGVAYYGSATDHLLPSSSYYELRTTDWNLVLACTVCNAFKGNWDPNDPVLYIRGSLVITPEDRQVLVDRAKTYVMKKRQAREEQFETTAAAIGPH